MQVELPRLGQVVLGSFRLQSPLGAGACATTFLAEQLGTERRAVVKFPHPHLLAGAAGSEIRRRFQVEAKAATRVSHPNLVTTFMVGETAQGLPGIAMEYVPGSPLAEYLRERSPIPLVELASLGQQIGEALAALHAGGIIHRDLSPANVMVTSDSTTLSVKLLDFGVAKLIGAPTQTLGPMGTPGYIAPEQLLGAATPRSDVYSLGGLLWWALTGHERPDDYHDGSLLRAMEDTVGPDPHGLRPDAPASLAAIVSRLLVPAEAHRLTLETFLEQWRAAFEATAIPQRLEPSSSIRSELANDKVVALVVGSTVVRSLIAERFRGLSSVKFRAVEPRELMRADPGSIDAAILDASYPGMDLPPLLRTFSELYPQLPVAVVGGAEHSAFPWERAGARAFFELPSGLTPLRTMLAEALGVAPVSSVPPAPVGEFGAKTLDQLVSTLVGGMPHWLAELEHALAHRDSRHAATSCRNILIASEKLGLVRLAHLARAGCAFVADGDLESAAAFVDPIRARYTEIFPELLPLLQPE